MILFLKKIFYFVLIILVYLIFEALIPINKFTHRPWEALTYFKFGFGKQFYPNQKLVMNSSGDLIYNVDFVNKKKEIWQTDEIGYRNNKLIKNPDFLLIGDSFIAGSGITQDSILSNALNYKSNSTYYNIAPATFNKFIDLTKNNIINKPKTIIFCLLEKNLPLPVNTKNGQEKFKEEFNIINDKISIYLDRLTRTYFLRYIHARILGNTGDGIKSKIDPRMYFNKVSPIDNTKNITQYLNILLSYKLYCDSNNINFIILLIPNKETVYYDKIPNKYQPDFLFKLAKLLEDNNIQNLNSLNLFNEQRKFSNKDLYQLDDIHWNSYSVNILADTLLKYTKDIDLMKQKKSF